MTLANEPKSERGFTIIEVMIVLAIAGLILLIVFLAVPALQRSARNTSRKEDAAAVLSAINEYTSNNGGSLPADSSLAFAAPTLTVGASGTAQSTAKLGYYTSVGTTPPGNIVQITSFSAMPSGPAADTLYVYKAASCSNATTAATGSARQIVALYGIESASGYSWQCQSS
jgi:prepilin-type N-terminal cleavage/methylation domain-containing protein